MGGGDSTSECQKVRSAGLGLVGFGGSVRWDMTDKECRLLELYAIKMREDNATVANRLWCSIKAVRSLYDDFTGCYDEAMNQQEPVPILMVDIPEREYAEHKAAAEIEHETVKEETEALKLQIAALIAKYEADKAAEAQRAASASRRAAADQEYAQAELEKLEQYKQ